jgi:hypothetical protein
MFKNIINWIKANKIVTIVLVILGFLLLRKSPGFGISSGVSRISSYDNMMSISPVASLPSSEGRVVATAKVASQARKVVTNSSFSLLVKKVNETIDSVTKEAEGMNGFVVNKVINRDEKADTATVEVRVPSDRLDEFSKYLRSISVKVVYENIMGYDITDQYTDYTTRLATLESSKSKLEGIMNRAVTAEEILNIQTRIFEIQDQIDSVKGQIAYMDKASSTSLVTISLSTDEMSLPYTPVKAWRPDIIFKQAVRALLGLIIITGTIGIWLVVFLPVLLLGILIKKLIVKFKKKK